MSTTTEQGASDRKISRDLRTDSELYPIALKLAGQRCLVVGGGPIALRKAQELLRSGALVHVVALEWPADFGALAREGKLSRTTRRFEASDLDGVFVVVAATDDPQVQQEVARGAEERGILCNVVDVNPLCNFYVPAILRRGSLTFAVTTDGKYPLLAIALRDRIASIVGPEFGPALDRLAEGRELVFARYPRDPDARLQALRRLLPAHALDLLVEGRLEEFEAHWESWKSSLSD